MRARSPSPCGAQVTRPVARLHPTVGESRASNIVMEGAMFTVRWRERAAATAPRGRAAAAKAPHAWELVQEDPAIWWFEKYGPSIKVRASARAGDSRDRPVVAAPLAGWLSPAHVEKVAGLRACSRAAPGSSSWLGPKGRGDSFCPLRRARRWRTWSQSA